MKMKNKQAEQNAAKLRHKEKLKANRRSQPNLERKEAFLNIKPTILIVCEGKNTEPSYFNPFISQQQREALGILFRQKWKAHRRKLECPSEKCKREFISYGQK